jgi:L-threonylcarbamoyladenylate synthase
MKTKILKGLSGAKEAGKIIREGGIVVFPTETVYGLGANAFDAEAVKKIFVAKGRPADNPLIVHVASIKDLEKVANEVPDVTKRLIERFWPGPLTLIFKKDKIIPGEVTAGLKTVAVRMPANQIALSIIKEAGVPVAAPSANLSGKPSGTRFIDVYNDFNGKVDVIIDGGRTNLGLESTVLDLTGKKPIVLRPGFVSLEMLREVLGNVLMYKGDLIKRVKSPGMKYKHYSPNVKVILVENKSKIKEVCSRYNKVVFIGLTDLKLRCKSNIFKNEKDFARNIFALFREYEKKFDAIVVEGVDEKGIGLALMNRLRKAASSVVK